MPGPIPMRESELARPRSRGQGPEAPQVTRGELRPTSPPEPNPEWHISARRLWDAALVSGQADFYQDTDWAMLHFLCGEMSDYARSSKKSSMMLASIMSGLTSLLLTEGDRRRARIELTAPEPEKPTAAVLALADYRDQLGLDED